MRVRTRSKTLQMANTDSTSNKLDAALAKMDDLLKSRDVQETKLNSILEKLSSLESSQKKNRCRRGCPERKLPLTGCANDRCR